MTTFHERIKSQSDQAHQSAEQAQFIIDLMDGSLNQGAYLDYLAALKPVYERMEELLRERGRTGVLAHFDHRALDRSEKISADITWLEGALSQSTSETRLPAITPYMQALRGDLSDAQLLAHHYIRYLGDLSGGQAISRLVSRHYQIPAEALNFYNFETLGDIVFYKNRYRDLLNLINFSSAEEEEFIDEVLKLYILNQNLFIGLGQIHAAPTETETAIA